MLPILSMIFITVATFYYMYKMHIDAIADVIPVHNDFSKVVHLVSETETINSIEGSKSINELNSNTQCSDVKLLNWKLHKNLETLVFLSELESRYNTANVVSVVVKEYYDLKKEVQKNTIEISNQLSYYKSLASQCA